MRHAFLTLALGPVFAAGAALGEPCPAPPDHGAGIAALISQAQKAENEGEARRISDRMWELWTDAPNEQAQAMLERAMGKRRSLDFLGALADLDALVAYCPDYAEGYNQRAFVNYLRGDFAGALGDLERAIALSPDHVGALSGRALTLLGLGRVEDARAALARALELNPWLSERALAAPGGPLAPPGEDI